MPGNREPDITPAEIEAGARALAERHFGVRACWPFDEFSMAQQQDFRDKATAVLEAVREVRHG